MEDSKLSSAIIKFIMGTMFLGMASLLPSMMEDMSKNANGTQLEMAIQDSFKSLSTIMGTTSYFIGATMIVMACFALYTVVKGEDLDFSSAKEKYTSSIKEEIVKDIKIKNNEIDFDNKELNNLVIMIKNLANELNQNEIVHKNPEWIFLVEKSKSEYVEKVYKNYMSLPKNKKLKNLTETKNQLTIILNGLVKVEDNLEKEVQKIQKANETFLNEKVKSIGEY